MGPKIMTASQRVLVVGDVIDDIVARVAMPVRPNTDTPARIHHESGGSAANTAVWLAAEGVAVDFVGRVGHSDAHRFESEFSAAGVTPFLEKDHDSTTGTIVILVEGELRSMLSDRGANAELDPAEIPENLLNQAALVHLTGYSFFHHRQPEVLATFISNAQAAGNRVMIDASSSGFLEDFGPDRFLDLIAKVDILRCNEDEASILSGHRDLGDAVTALSERFPAIVATRGGQGALVFEGGHLSIVEAVAVERVVDPTGAGDSFNAGILAGLISGGSIVDATVRAAQISARCVTQVGARP
jgi:sugar/nucleoside kinase (ribokinase family)